jgi:cystathionine beta-synthase
MVYAEELISHAIAKMRKYSISQIPVMKDGKFVGSLDDSTTYQYLIEDQSRLNDPISSIMQKAFPIVKASASIEEISKLINKETPAVLVEMEENKFNIITKQDIISAIS